MGAHSCWQWLDKDCSEREARETFLALQQALTREYGANPYNGTFSTMQGIEFPRGSAAFADEKAALAYILGEWVSGVYREGKAEKWGAAIAVKVAGHPGWLIGGWAAS